MKGKMTMAVMPNDDYQVEDDLRTLCRAAEIHKDPKRMKACQAMAKKKAAEMEKVAGMSDGDE
jgi:hypothetical protein